MRIHTQYPTIECNICGKRFRRNIQRDNHIKERHGAPIPKRERRQPLPPKARKSISTVHTSRVDLRFFC